MTRPTTQRMDALSAWFADTAAGIAAEPPRRPFTAAEYADRLVALRAAAVTAGLDVLVLTAPDAMCWLTGYDARWYRSHSSTTMPPSQCVLVPVRDEEPLVHVETGEHAALVDLTSVVDEFVPIPASANDHEPTLDEFTGFVVAQLRSHGWLSSADGRPVVVGVERWSSVPNPATLTALETELRSAGAVVHDATAPIRSVRRLKSPVEVELIERAQLACDAGTRHLVSRLRPGLTELEAWALYIEGMVAAGGEPTAMHETIAAGPIMPMVHLASSRRALRAGEYLHTDVAAAVHRYHARGTRTVFLGPVPALLAEASEVIAAAHDVVVAAGQVGRTFGELGQALSTFFAGTGLDGWAGGYELGLSFPPDWVGEFTWMSTNHDHAAVIEDGLVTNLEIGVAGLAMVDTIVFTSAGPRILSSLPRRCLEAGS